ncbi:MAG: hypothetical protein OXB90_02945 [Acidimicrobiaceae bacterium]|nr:hypothetical protein [Acidimicrobiaceae bacterium]
MIAVESRRRLGYDSGIVQRLPVPALMHTVDAAVSTRAPPVKGAQKQLAA